MCRLLETIRIENGEVCNLHLHQARMNRSLSLLKIEKAPSLINHFEKQQLLKRGIFKHRIIYGETILNSETLPYKVRPINSLKLVHCNDIDYSMKWEDRKMLNTLFQQRKNCDDVLIIKDGMLTDSSYCNIALQRKGKWFTPSRPLLNGTVRQLLLSEHIIDCRDITVDSLSDYSSIRLFNAMLPWDRAIELPISALLH